TAIFSVLLPRPNSTMRMCAGIFRPSMSSRHELNVRSHQGRKKGHLFRDARDSGWSGSEGISARSYGKYQRRTAWLKAIARETSTSEAASERYCGVSSEY